MKRSIACALLSCLLAGAALAQSFPSRPLKRVVPYPPGGITDTLGRTLAQADLMAGRISLMFSDMSAMPHVKSGRLRALGMTSAKRIGAFPEMPTVAGCRRVMPRATTNRSPIPTRRWT